MSEKLRVMKVFHEGARLIQAVVGFAGSWWEANLLVRKFDRTGHAWIEFPQAPATKTIPDPGSKNKVHFVEAVKSTAPISGKKS